MIVSAELNQRLLLKAVARDPSLATDEARLRDLSRQIMRSPDRFATDDEDRALVVLDRVVSQGKREIDDELDAAADAYEQNKPHEPSRLPKTRALVRQCLEIDPCCYDARTIEALIDSDSTDAAIEALVSMADEARAWCESRSAALDDSAEDLWDRVCLRPWLRLESKIVDLLLQACSYREALSRCENMLEASPKDGQGMRHTAALLYARLEDEDGLDGLDVRYGRSGSCWMHVARSVLLYKLGRMGAARRATVGMANLCPGAAFYIANPSYVPPYMTDRPPFKPGSDQESLLATFEADFIVVDTPEYVQWAMSVPEFSAAAARFGKRHGDL